MPTTLTQPTASSKFPSRVDLPTVTVTFLFTDVDGSTRVLHELEAEGYAEALAEHRRLIRDACAGQGGVEVDVQGDGFAFPAAPEAVAAAAALSEALGNGPSAYALLAVSKPDIPSWARRATSGGRPGRGDQVAAAERAGQVILTDATASLVEPELTGLGEHRLKDIDSVRPNQKNRRASARNRRGRLAQAGRWANATSRPPVVDLVLTLMASGGGELGVALR